MKALLLKMTTPLKPLVTPFKPLVEKIFQIEAYISHLLVKSAHYQLKKVQWSLPPQPEHFDHHIDLFYQWLKTRNPLWLERGVFGSLALKGGGVLELACGDGFNSRNFYSLRSDHVIACDFDTKAIQTAKRKNSCKNVEYVLCDIRTDMPNGKFSNVVLDAAIEHFTINETKMILNDIKDRLKQNGVLSGYTIVEKSNGIKSLSHHEYEFKNKEDLLRLLSPYFINITVFETIYPSRHNLYFWASDGVLPFSPEWANSVFQKKTKD